jgi:riboflavin kinase/FMN adenylyltransferase
VNIAYDPAELPAGERAVAVGSFDGVHRGHRRVLETALAAGLPAAVVTFWPHPRLVLGNRVELLSTLRRRLELFEEAGIPETLVLEFTPELAQLEPRDFAETILRRIGARVIVVGEDFRFGHAASGDAGLLAELGFDVRPVPVVEGVSSTRIRRLVAAGDVEGGAELLGRPPELEGVVVLGDERGGTLGFPTANLDVPRELLVPAYGIYAGATEGRRAAISIGVNPHYGGAERRIEAYLLDFEGNLYGERLVLELWRRLREEQAFGSEEELVRQIAADVEQTRLASRPPSPERA